MVTEWRELSLRQQELLRSIEPRDAIKFVSNQQTVLVSDGLLAVEQPHAHTGTQHPFQHAPRRAFVTSA